MHTYSAVAVCYIDLFQSTIAFLKSYSLVNSNSTVLMASFSLQLHATDASRISPIEVRRSTA